MKLDKTKFGGRGRSRTLQPLYQQLNGFEGRAHHRVHCSSMVDDSRSFCDRLSYLLHLRQTRYLNLGGEFADGYRYLRAKPHR